MPHLPIMEDLKFYIVTFNSGRELVEVDPFANHLLDGWEDPDSKNTRLPDAIILTLQEFAPLSYAFLGGNLVKPYFDRFRQAVPIALQAYSDKTDTDVDDFVNVISHNLGLTALMMFARKDLVSKISSVQMAEIGVGDYQMGNKGAVAARIGWDVSGDDEKLVYTTFVGAHLAPMEEEVQRRDQNYVDIVKGLVFSKQYVHNLKKEQASEEVVPLLGSSSNTELTEAKGIYCDDSYLFFSGDLNYRTALTSPGQEDSKLFPQPRQDPDNALHYRHLLSKDQLQREHEQGKTLHGLTEQSIDFPPTYKYKMQKEKPVILDEDITEWQWAQHRWPSWCDRILFSHTDSLPVKAGKYSALPTFRTSDHRPVALCVSVPTQAVSDLEFSKLAPATINRQWQDQRITARRTEIIVGLGAYLGLTWEGNSLLLGTIFVVVGGTFMLKNLG